MSSSRKGKGIALMCDAPTVCCHFHRFQPNTDITAMLSVEGEIVPLKRRIKPSEAGGAVEKWLIQVIVNKLALMPALHALCAQAIKFFHM